MHPADKTTPVTSLLEKEVGRVPYEVRTKLQHQPMFTHEVAAVAKEVKPLQISMWDNGVEVAAEQRHGLWSPRRMAEPNMGQRQNVAAATANTVHEIYLVTADEQSIVRNSETTESFCANKRTIKKVCKAHNSR